MSSAASNLWQLDKTKPRERIITTFLFSVNDIQLLTDSNDLTWLFIILYSSYYSYGGVIFPVQLTIGIIINL